MKTLTSELKTHLESGGPYEWALLVTLGLVDGSAIYRWNDGDTDLTVASTYFNVSGTASSGTFTWSCPASGAPIIPPTITTDVQVGLVVEDCQVELGFADSSLRLGGKEFTRAAVDGAFDGARVMIERVFLHTDGTPIPNPLIRFVGFVDKPEPSSTLLRLNCVSALAKLQRMQMPRHVFNQTCTHIFGDAGCGVDITQVSPANYCKRTWRDCYGFNNLQRFRAQPSMPRPDSASGYAHPALVVTGHG